MLAEQVGVDCFGVGEHHRPDFAVSAPEVVLAAIAGKTERIILGSAVTVLSTDDPVRVFQRFSTLDAVSNGRAEVILGRGSFTESYPLFGYDLSQYNELFEEKLDLFVRLLDQKPVTWSGRTRSSLTNQVVYPPVENGRLRTWIGVGGSPESVVRAAKHGLPLTLAIIGGSATRFIPYVELYRRTLAQLGKPTLPIGVHSPGHVAATDEQAKEELWPHYAGDDEQNRPRAGLAAARPRRLRAGSGARRRPLCRRSGNGGGEDRRRRVKALGASRFDLKYSSGTLPHAAMMRSIELYGSEVVPRVRRQVT